jgi:hypothetical protein
MKNRITHFGFFLILGFILLSTMVINGHNNQPIDTQQTTADKLKQIENTDTSEKSDLRILYAGLPNTDRAKDFMDFLTKYFKKVEFTDYNNFKEDLTANFDVTIIDHNGVGFRAPLPKISRQYSRATVTMGVPGAHICSRLSLKTGYL